MKEVKQLSVKTNLIFNLIIQILTYLLPLITAPYLSRTLLANGIGTSSFLNSITSYFVLIVAFGFTTYGTQKISAHKKEKSKYSKIFWEIMFSKLILFIFCYILFTLIAVIWKFGKNFELKYFFAYSVLIIATLFDTNFLFNGLEDFRIISIVRVIIKIVGTICLFIFIKTEQDLFRYILISVFVDFFVFFISFILSLRIVSRPVIKELHTLKCLKSALFYFLPTIAISIYTILDKTMMGYLTTEVEIGYYEEAHKIIILVTSLINAISPIMLARISDLVAENNVEEIKKKYIQMSKVYWLISAPAICGLYAIGDAFIPVFYGAEFAPSIGVLYILTPLIAVIPISNIIGSAYYIPNNRIKIQTLFFSIGGIINFSLNFIFIKKWGAIGAATTSLISEIIISSLFVVFSLKEMDYLSMLKSGIKIIISSLAMFVCVVLFEKFFLVKYISYELLNVIFATIFGMVIYSVLLILNREEFILNILKNFFNRARLSSKEGAKDE